MRKYYFILLLLFVSGVLFGQAYENPVNWSTSNSYSIYNSAGASVFKSTDAKDLSFAARLESKNAALLGKVIPGVITTGTITSEGSVTGGQSYTTRSKKLVGYYKYSPQGVDMAGIEVFLSKWNAATYRRDTIAYGKIKKGAATTYTAFEVMLTYKNTVDNPDTQLITISSSADRSNAVAESILFVDNLAFSDAPTSINNYSVDLEASIVYPNPTNDFLNISVSENFNIQIVNINGSQIVYQSNVAANQTHIVDVKGFATGIYMVKISNNKFTQVQKVIINGN